MIFDEEKIKNLLSIETQPTTGEIDKILSRAKLKKGLTVEEVAVLLRLDDEENKQKLLRVKKSKMIFMAIAWYFLLPCTFLITALIIAGTAVFIATIKPIEKN